MPINYITKQKYMDAAPDWEIDGGQGSRAVPDYNYMPENAERVEREDDKLAWRTVVLAHYYDSAGCASGREFIAAYPEPRQIKVWCERKPK